MRGFLVFRDVGRAAGRPVNVTSGLYIDILFSLKRAAARYTDTLETDTLFCGAVDSLDRSLHGILESGCLVSVTM